MRFDPLDETVSLIAGQHHEVVRIAHDPGPGPVGRSGRMAGDRLQLVATGCPACMMQLLDSTHRYGSKQRVRHYISLLADAYRAEKEVEAHADVV